MKKNYAEKKGSEYASATGRLYTAWCLNVHVNAGTALVDKMHPPAYPEIYLLRTSR